MNDNQQLGSIGESKALQFLTQIGYQLRHKNWRFGRYELDLVMQKGDLIIFVEVKTRSSLPMAAPEDAVNKSKMRKIIASADAYLEEYHLDCESQFDIIAIEKKGAKEFEIRHIENAFDTFEI